MCILSLDVGLTDAMKRELVYDNVDDYRFRIFRNIQHFVTAQDSSEGDVSSGKALEMYCKLVQVIYYTKNCKCRRVSTNPALHFSISLPPSPQIS